MASPPINTNNSPRDDTDSPPQRHAGKVGYGPYFHAGPVSSLNFYQGYSFSCLIFSKTLEDKIMGLKEVVVGKLTQNPEKVSHGHQILTGEEKRKKLTGEVRI